VSQKVVSKNFVVKLVTIVRQENSIMKNICQPVNTSGLRWLQNVTIYAPVERLSRADNTYIATRNHAMGRINPLQKSQKSQNVSKCFLKNRTDMNAAVGPPT